MKFNDPEVERKFVLTQWRDDRTIIRLFAFTILAHTIYLILIQFLLTTYVGILSYILIFALYTPITVLVVILAFTNPFHNKTTMFLWYLSLTIVSIMVALGIIIRSLLCYYN